MLTMLISLTVLTTFGPTWASNSDAILPSAGNYGELPVLSNGMTEMYYINSCDVQDIFLVKEYCDIQSYISTCINVFFAVSKPSLCFLIYCSLICLFSLFCSIIGIQKNKVWF